MEYKLKDKKLLSLLKISAVLWIVWGIVHLFAGIITMSVDTSQGFSGIAAGVESSELDMQYHDAVGAILNQHGFNLAWIGLFTLICAFYIWKGNFAAVFLNAIVGGVTDVGYFIFIDLGGYGTFMPGTVMIIFSGTAVVLGLYAYYADCKK